MMAQRNLPLSWVFLGTCHQKVHWGRHCHSGWWDNFCYFHMQQGCCPWIAAISSTHHVLEQPNLQWSVPWNWRFPPPWEWLRFWQSQIWRECTIHHQRPVDPSHIFLVGLRDQKHGLSEASFTCSWVSIGKGPFGIYMSHEGLHIKVRFHRRNNKGTWNPFFCGIWGDGSNSIWAEYKVFPLVQATDGTRNRISIMRIRVSEVCCLFLISMTIYWCCFFYQTIYWFS